MSAPGSRAAPAPGATLSCEDITPTKQSESLTGTQIIEQIDRTFTTSTMMMLTDALTDGLHFALTQWKASKPWQGVMQIWFLRICTFFCAKF